MDSDRDEVKPITQLWVLENEALCQLEATYIKSAHNMLVLTGLKIFLTFEKERLKLVGRSAAARSRSL